MFKNITSFYKSLRIFRIKYEADMKIANILFNKTFIAGGIIEPENMKDEWKNDLRHAWSWNTNSDDRMMKPDKPFDKMDMVSVGKRMEEIFKDIKLPPQTKYGKDYLKG